MELRFRGQAAGVSLLGLFAAVAGPGAHPTRAHQSAPVETTAIYVARVAPPEPAIEARTLADLGQAREATEAAHTPAAAESGPRPAAGRSANRTLQRQR